MNLVTMDWCMEERIDAFMTRWMKMLFSIYYQSTHGQQLSSQP